jgi:hypothetical protein
MPSSKCRPGYIRRRSYSKRHWKSGKKFKVPSSCIKDRGLKGKGPYILPRPTPGLLTQYGYSHIKSLTKSERRHALRKAIKVHGHNKIIKHLNLIANYIHRTNPTVYKLFKRDQRWISKMYKKSKKNLLK